MRHDLQQQRVAVAVGADARRRRARCRWSRPSPTARRASGSRTRRGPSRACARRPRGWPRRASGRRRSRRPGRCRRRARRRRRRSAAGSTLIASAGRARGRPAFTSSTVCVPSWKIEAASAASAPASSASARCSGRPAPPEATTGTFTVAQIVSHELEVVAVLHAVGVHRRDQQLAGAELDGSAPQATASQSVGLRPPSTYARQPPSGSRRASIAQTMHCEPKRSAASPIRLGPRQRAGVERDLVGAGQQQLAHASDAVDRRRPP